MTDEPQHLPHCKPVQINWIGISGTPSAGWQCVAECPNYQARMAALAAEGEQFFAARYGSMPST
jgi:hypothetical protein